VDRRPEHLVNPARNEKPATGRVSRWPILLLAVLAVEGLAATALHRSDEQLRTQLERGSGTDQVEALFLLTNRGASPGLDEATWRAVMQSPNPLVREWCLTTNFSRFSPDRPISVQLAPPADSREAHRRWFLDVHRIGKRRNISRSAFEEFLTASSPEE
jgi:hypothetical protein